ncbi:MAG: hypothetical protein CL916_08490 [Deltaproteobacteria bacterium]|nr:hypothetical protein [Deltaproteobacteria bacterium]
MILIFGGCSIPSDIKVDTPVSYEYEASQISSFSDSTAMEEEVNEVITQMRSYHSREIVDSYYDVINYADTQCPTSYEVDDNAFWYGYCSSRFI